MVFAQEVTTGTKARNIRFIYIREDGLPINKANTAANAKSKKYIMSIAEANPEMNAVPGSVFDPNGKLISCPENRTQYVVDGKEPKNYVEPHPDSIRLNYVDGTAIHLYWHNGIMHMGTRNSWDISTMSDFVEDMTFLDFFKETAAAVGFDYECLDPKISHTILFSNPSIHFYSREHRIIYYNEDLVGEEIEEDDYTTYDPVNKMITVHITGNMKKVLNAMYNQRRVCKSNTWFEAFYKLVEKWHHDGVYEEIINYMPNHTIFAMFRYQ